MLIGNYFKKINTQYKDHYFSGLSFNSLTCKKRDIFFAIKGNKTDGNSFINEAIKNGAKTIISNDKFEGLKKKILYIKAKNVRKLLAKTAYKFFKDKPKNLIAVTGTNGKSSIAEFYFQILTLSKKKVASIGTMGIKTRFGNSTVINTTLDPLKLGYYLSKIKKQNVNNLILEASSHGLKQNRLDGLEFKTAIFTNLSHDHLDYHNNFKDYLNSKLYLFKKLLGKKSNIITDINIPEYKKIKNIAAKQKLNLKTISENGGDLLIVSHKYLGESQLIKIKYRNRFHNFKLNLIGKIQIKNILMSMIAAEKSNLKFKNVVKVIDKIKPVKGRLEKVGNIKNRSCVILDYAHTPIALKTCLQNLKEQFKDKNISIVFGCGGDRDKLKRSKMGKIANAYCDRIYLTDDNPRNENPKKIRLEIKKKINKSKLYEIGNRKKAIHNAIEGLKTGEVLVIAGKGHENIQDYGNSKIFFSDRKYILQFIKKKNNKLSQNFKLNILREECDKSYFSRKINIKNASINSKEIKKDDIFFAIKGKKKDGNSFLNEAFKKQASLAVINKFNNSEKKNKQIKVKDTLKFLSKASKIVRENCSSKIIAITGSCGKTSLKEMLAKTLNEFAKTSFSPKSYNNKYGVPVSLFNLNSNDKYGVFEVGMDKKGEIDFLTKIIKPDIGVITNISYAHAKNFKNIKQIALAKSEIINNISKEGALVLNADDNFFDLHKKMALKKNLNIYSFSMKKKDANIKFNSIKKIGNKFRVSINIEKQKKYFLISSNFDNNIKNLLAAITIISIIGEIKNLNKNSFNNFNTPEGRGDIQKIKIKKKNIYLIDESYNSNPLSLRSAIKNFDSIKNINSKKHLILGDMLELGKHSKKQHLEMSKIINASSIHSINVFGKYIKETYRNIYKSKQGLILKGTSEIFNLIKNNLDNNDYVMIKGSNSTGLNKLTRNLKTGNFNAL
jgi:murE/murF fusion protein